MSEKFPSNENRRESLEKNDLFAMMIAAALVFFPVFAVLAGICCLFLL